MIFSDFYRSPRSPLSKLRHHHNQGSAHLPTATPDWVAAEYADLLSKDKAKQKEAVKRYLSDKDRRCKAPVPVRTRHNMRACKSKTRLATMTGTK
ncbi:hypothetical protein G6O67_004715 [Ophiocordyceps sinensis]|uniref:Uncharacterized protein n=1 Tax=Ophiocordyceps sinensis TaxID=72228 RepID=A0A8H4PQ25_9HYPO|nr:hypothetical protein G6O67_004715 [Ophiocordyceps sinensis]